MATPRGEPVDTGLYLQNGATYGMAMPVVVEFGAEIPESARASVERRMFVTTTPPQPGAWGWFSGRQALYRGQNYWQPGTKLSVRIALGGHPMGNKRFGDMDRSATATIADTRTRVEVDNATKHMSVYQNDRLLRSVPVSLGKPSTPSSSGTMVIMEKHVDFVFDTRGDPMGGYVVPVKYAQRLTWGGEFIHAAPWSVYDQGRRNVSHGCVNLSMDNAAWVFSVTRVGDPVVVRGTEVGLDPGNGWTGWNLSWEDFLKRSSLPHPEPAAAAAAPSRSPN
jgi:lipoprotein-anchoring transpeptidase ErfK/SrfK